MQIASLLSTIASAEESVAYANTIRGAFLQLSYRLQYVFSVAGFTKIVQTQSKDRFVKVVRALLQCTLL